MAARPRGCGGVVASSDHRPGVPARRSAGCRSQPRRRPVEAARRGRSTARVLHRGASRDDARTCSDHRASGSSGAAATAGKSVVPPWRIGPAQGRVDVRAPDDGPEGPRHGHQRPTAQGTLATRRAGTRPGGRARARGRAACRSASDVPGRPPVRPLRRCWSPRVPRPAHLAWPRALLVVRHDLVDHLPTGLTYPSRAASSASAAATASRPRGSGDGDPSPASAAPGAATTSSMAWTTSGVRKRLR